MHTHMRERPAVAKEERENLPLFEFMALLSPGPAEAKRGKNKFPLSSSLSLSRKGSPTNQPTHTLCSGGQLLNHKDGFMKRGEAVRACICKDLAQFLLLLEGDPLSRLDQAFCNGVYLCDKGGSAVVCV